MDLGSRLVFQGALALRFCAVLIALGLVTGCGPKLPQRVPISGQVQIDGQPLERGFIQVVPDDGPAATGEIGSDGRFRLTTFDPDDGCVVGTHRVVVIANRSKSPTELEWFAPKEYADPLTTTITLAVTQPQEDVVIKLTWNGGQPFIEKFQDEGTPPPAAAADAPAGPPAQ